MSLFLGPDTLSIFPPHVGDECSMPLLIFLSMCSVILHEAGHLLAAISAGQKIDHIGITFWSIIPTGAYISVDDKINSRKSEQMQFGLAGIEVNLLITGICLILIEQTLLSNFTNTAYSTKYT